ncbi:MAG: hypothetical protein DRP01_02390 [Archaeoglobales archaeon]|nr:MAG: hypothetical protein DRP01_02390 [Archaeoglobales archaeon]
MGFGMGRRGMGRRRGRGPGGLGPSGFCVCPKCGYREPHEMGIPCRKKKCPNCGTTLVREGGVCY